MLASLFAVGEVQPLKGLSVSCASRIRTQLSIDKEGIVFHELVHNSPLTRKAQVNASCMENTTLLVLKRQHAAPPNKQKFVMSGCW